MAITMLLHREQDGVHIGTAAGLWPVACGSLHDKPGEVELVERLWVGVGVGVRGCLKMMALGVHGCADRAY